MINNDDTNAFPYPLGQASVAEPSQSGGMTLRDYFAAKAMQGELASQANGSEWVEIDRLAKYSYSIADEMLKARKS